MILFIEAEIYLNWNEENKAVKTWWNLEDWDEELLLEAYKKKSGLLLDRYMVV